MKAALICPVPDLERFVDERATTHLLLSHLKDVPGYIDFYRRRADAGDYVIVDNGAKENTFGARLKETLEFAQEALAHEVVLTDVRYQCRSTIEAARRELKWLSSLDGRDAFGLAGYPRMMVVPQGANPKQWRYCFKALLNLSHVHWPHRKPVVAVAYHYDHMFEDGLLPLLEYVYKSDPELEVHLLGWTRRLSTLREAAHAFPQIRSVDSSRPFVYGKHGLPADNRVEYPTRDRDFFTSSIPSDTHSVVRLNIRLFRLHAHDEAAGEGSTLTPMAADE